MDASIDVQSLNGLLVLATENCLALIHAFIYNTLPCLLDLMGTTDDRAWVNTVCTDRKCIERPIAVESSQTL